jgi:hypothetical protein
MRTIRSLTRVLVTTRPLANRVRMFICACIDLPAPGIWVLRSLLPVGCFRLLPPGPEDLVLLVLREPLALWPVLLLLLFEAPACPARQHGTEHAVCGIGHWTLNSCVNLPTATRCHCHHCHWAAATVACSCHCHCPAAAAAARRRCTLQAAGAASRSRCPSPSPLLAAVGSHGICLPRGGGVSPKR